MNAHILCAAHPAIFAVVLLNFIVYIIQRIDQTVHSIPNKLIRIFKCFGLCVVHNME